MSTGSKNYGFQHACRDALAKLGRYYNEEDPMDVDLIPLADAVLPLIRTNRRDLWRYSASNEQGSRMIDGASLLEVAVDSPATLPDLGIQVPTPKETYAVAHKALASAIRVIGRADDSAGIIGSACRQLIRLHPLAAAAAAVPQVKLADWVYKFHFDEAVDYFNLDPVAYAPALGDKGIARLRELVAGLHLEIATTPGANPQYSYDHREFLAQWFDQRFAVLDRDLEAIIATHLRDAKVAAWYEDVAGAFEEIGEVDLAISWAHQAMLFDRGHQARTAARRWWRLLEAHQPQELSGAARLIFDRWPTAEAAAHLVALTGEALVDYVQSVLAKIPDDLIAFQLDTLDAPKLAWHTAQGLEGLSNGTWDKLAQAYFVIDPLAALEIQLKLIDATLTEANTRRYRPAALELKKLRQAAIKVSPEAGALVDQGIRDLRATYNRRPSFLAALDRAKLP